VANEIRSILHPAVQAIGWALLHFVWQGALLAAFVATIFRSAPSAPHVTVVTATDRPAIAAAPPHTGRAPLADLPAWPMHRENALPGWAVCLWLAGVAVLSIYTAAGWMRVRTLRQRSASPLNAEWNDTLHGLMQKLRISRPVRLCSSTIAEVPALIGWLRPCILLPVAAVAGLSESQLRAVLAHELAHIRRHDYLVNLLQAMVETLLFYHPAVWWVSRRIREEREHCCDDLAVSVCGDVIVYASALAQLEELRGAISEPALAATGGDLLARIRRLLGEEAASRMSGPAGAAIAASLLLGAAISLLGAQEPPAPKFEVVSVKPCDPGTMQPGARSGPSRVSVGRLTMECMTVRSLIMMAHVEFASVHHRFADLELTPLEGGPEWIGSARYTIDARADGPASNDTMRGPMLRALLEDRFQLKTHHETREIPVYELTVAKGGFKLQPAAEGSCTPGDQRRTLKAGEKPYCGQAFFDRKGLDITADLRSMTLQEFADWILLGMDRLVFDKTGIQGKYDFHLEYAADETMRFYRMAEPGAVAEFPPLTTVLQQFGLKLAPAKGPGQFLVIDHVERPTEN
jgi:uncharacterized protein (TIGR03435 family)